MTDLFIVQGEDQMFVTPVFFFGVPLRDRSVGRVPRADGRGGAGCEKALDGVTAQGAHFREKGVEQVPSKPSDTRKPLINTRRCQNLTT